MYIYIYFTQVISLYIYIYIYNYIYIYISLHIIILSHFVDGEPLIATWRPPLGGPLRSWTFGLAQRGRPLDLTRAEAPGDVHLGKGHVNVSQYMGLTIKYRNHMGLYWG